MDRLDSLIPNAFVSWARVHRVSGIVTEDLPGITRPERAGGRPARTGTGRTWIRTPVRRRSSRRACRDSAADQISRRYFGRDQADPASWSELAGPLAEQIAGEWFPELLEPVTDVSCDDGDTVKTVWRLTGGGPGRSVVMAYPRRVTACVSSQAGCGIGCPFCATGQGVDPQPVDRRDRRTSAPGTRAGQFRGVRRSPDHLTNIVFMGMGEPLANYRALVAALHRIIDPAPAGFGMSARNVTVSTVGLVPHRRAGGRGLPSPWRCRCMPRTTNCATRWCRSTIAGR